MVVIRWEICIYHQFVTCMCAPLLCMAYTSHSYGAPCLFRFHSWVDVAMRRQRVLYILAQCCLHTEGFLGMDERSCGVAPTNEGVFGIISSAYSLRDWFA